jgi:nucleoid-associated protein YgaU
MNPTDNLYYNGVIVEYKEGDKSLERFITPLVFDLYDKNYTIKQGDTLPKLADYFYDSSRLWWVIADNNQDIITNIFELEVGKQIIIPNYKKLQ